MEVSDNLPGVSIISDFYVWNKEDFKKCVRKSRDIISFSLIREERDAVTFMKKAGIKPVDTFSNMGYNTILLFLEKKSTILRKINAV